MDSWRFDVDDPSRPIYRRSLEFRRWLRTQEIELSRHVLANDEQAESAGETLVEANLAMVVSIAERYPRENIYLLDLVQKGK